MTMFFVGVAATFLICSLVVIVAMLRAPVLNEGVFLPFANDDR